MRKINQIILSVYVVDVELIPVAPSNRPRFGVAKRVATVFETIVLDMSDAEVMFMSEMFSEIRIWNCASATSFH